MAGTGGSVWSQKMELSLEMAILRPALLPGRPLTGHLSKHWHVSASWHRSQDSAAARQTERSPQISRPAEPGRPSSGQPAGERSATPCEPDSAAEL